MSLELDLPSECRHGPMTSILHLTFPTPEHSLLTQLRFSYMLDPANWQQLTRGKLLDNRCWLGCDDVESMRHIFVNCAIYQQWRHEAQEQLVHKSMLKLETMKIGG